MIAQLLISSICLFNLLTQFWQRLGWLKVEAFNEIILQNNFIEEKQLYEISLKLRVQLFSSYYMSFFFGKSDSEDNLQYDDTASLHFGISLCIITTIVFVGLIYRDISGRKKKNVKMIKSVQALTTKAQNSAKFQKSYLTSGDFLYKIGIIVGCILFGLYLFSNVDQNSKMIGFDPHQILGVSLDAEVNTIKKAYRKLALQFHPDRNQNNPEVAAKFIQISKAYECLTNEQAKQKCKKYGNPDGQTSFKVGIGLPRFMVDMQNQYFILIPIFIFLLVVVPISFIKWSNRIKPMDDHGNLLVNYQTFLETMIPGMNPITFSVIMGTMKQLDTIFPDENAALDPQLDAGMRNLLLNTRAIIPDKVEKIPKHILSRICIVYSHMANRQRSQKLEEHIPELCRKIAMFAYNFTQRAKDKQMLFNNPNWILNYYGIQPLTMSLFFSKQMFNPSIRLGDTKSIEFLDLNAEQDLLARNLPIGNLQYNLLWDDQKIDSLVGNFQEDRQKYIRQQVQALPALKIEAKVLLGQQEATEMTIDDFAIIQIKVIRKKPTPGYVLAKDYSYLAKEQFYIILSYSQNVVLFRPVFFKQGSNEAVFKYTHRQSFVRNMKFQIDVISNCYPNMDLQQEINLNVIGRIENRTVQINKDDINIQKHPKSFIESLASMDAYNQSDKQLSQGSDDQEQQVKQMKEKKKGFQQDEEQQGVAESQNYTDEPHKHQQKGCCDHDHHQSEAKAFKQQN